MQNFDIDVDKQTDKHMNKLTDEQKDENYIPSTYFICRGYNECQTSVLIWMTEH